MATVLQMKLMQSPLVTWLKTFKENDSHLTYRELCDGSFLREVMMQIESSCGGDRSVYRCRPKHVEDNVITLGVEVDDAIRSLLNWSLLLKSVRSFYLEELQQVVVMKMPDVVAITKEPDSESCPEDIRRAMLLLLGCAVQCERKEYFISRIMALDTDAQHSIMEHIQEITDGSTGALILDIPVEELGSSQHNVYYHLHRVVAERDQYIDDIAKITIENDLHELALTEQLQQQRSDANTSATLSPAQATDRHHLAVELADSKAKLRRLRMDLEEKSEAVQELRDEVTELKQTVAKLRQENLTLTQDARSARSYRDELDIYKEKARRADKLETELARYKERINELDFYKARVDELREDNKILLETKTMLEEQLATSQKRVETIIELENELMKCKLEAEEMSHERDHDRYRLRELAEEVARLEHDKKSTLSESASLEEELLLARSHMSSELNSSLSEQLLDTTKAEMLQLQLENQRLQRLVTDMKEQSVLESSSRLIELEKENQRLSKKVAKLLESSSRETEQAVLAEQRSTELERQLVELRQTMDTVSENHERQRNELEKENEQLLQTVEALRERGEKTHDLRVKDVERENKRMTECMSEMSSRVSRLEYDNRQLQKSLERASEHSDKVKQIEEDNEKLTRESVDLHKKITALKLTCDRYEHLEQELGDLQIENKRLQKLADSARSAAARLERADVDAGAAAAENQQLLRTLEALRTSSAERLAEAERDRERVAAELADARLNSERKQQETAARLATAEARCAVLAADCERLRSAADAAAQRHAEERAALESESWRLAANVEALKASMQKLESLESDGRRLEEESAAVARECSALDKENRRLKQLLETKEAAAEEQQTRAAGLERELKALKKTVEKGRDTVGRVKELEAENKDLMQQLAVDKKTVATLREDLINEKIRTQQLNNELERLKSELDKMGLDKEKLAALERAHEDSRYHALEAMMQDAVSKNAEVNRERIKTLERSLEDAKQINATLQKQLETLTREYEAYLLRRTEEPKVSTLEIPSFRAPQTSVSQLVIKERKPVVAKEILEMKDQVIAVERRNAVLLSENERLKAQYTYCQEQLQKAETQLSSLSSHVSTVQADMNQLQSKNAQLQVENTTLQSQVTSHTNQNAVLQQQLAKLEAELEKFVVEHQESVDNYETLANDHESLQKLNEQLSSEYESLLSEHTALKLQHRSTRGELLELAKQRENVAKEKAAVEELQQSLAKERDAIAADSRRGDAAAAERDRWRDEAAALRQQNERVNSEYRRLQQDYRAIKTESNQLKLCHTQLQGDMADCKDQINRMDVELSKLVNRCEALEQLNGKLEEENRQLIGQLQALLQQNYELLQQTLDRSEHFHEEERAYVEQLNSLQKHKEKLEGKIMDHYRSLESKPKKKSFDFLRKAKGFIAKRKDKRDLSRSQLDLQHSDLASQAGQPGQYQPIQQSGQYEYQVQQQQQQQHHDTVSMVSAGSSHGDANESGSEVTLSKSHKVRLRKTRMRAQSIENLFAAPAANSRTSLLSVHHKQLAASTASLNVPGPVRKLREVSITIPLEPSSEGNRGPIRSKDGLPSSNSTSDYYAAHPVLPRSVTSGFTPSYQSADHGRRWSGSSEDSNVPTRDTDVYQLQQQQQGRPHPDFVGAGSRVGPVSLEQGDTEGDDGARKVFYTPQPFSKGQSASLGASASVTGARISAVQAELAVVKQPQPGGTPGQWNDKQQGGWSAVNRPSSYTGIDGSTAYTPRKDYSQGYESRTSTPKVPSSPAGLPGAAGDRWIATRGASGGSGGGGLTSSSSSRSITPIRDVYGSTQQLSSSSSSTAMSGLQRPSNVYPDAALCGSLQRQPRMRAGGGGPTNGSVASMPDSFAPQHSGGAGGSTGMPRPSSMPLQGSNGSTADRLGQSKVGVGGVDAVQQRRGSNNGGSAPNDPSQATSPQSPNAQWYEYGCV